jgi:hypothetical protein
MLAVLRVSSALLLWILLASLGMLFYGQSGLLDPARSDVQRIGSLIDRT